MKRVPGLLFILFISLIVYISSCQIGTVDPSDQSIGKNFYPLKIGNFIVYDIHKVKFHELIEHDTSFYQLKEVVADTFRNSANELVYRIERFRRTTLSEPWGLDSVWTSRLDENTRYIKTENNIPFIKFVLPVENGITWDANAFNSLGVDNYTLEDYNKRYQLDDFIFNNTIKINQNFDTSFISRDDRIEIYADTIGLIYKRAEVLQYVADSQDERYKHYFIVGGSFLEQKYFDHGIE